MKKKRIAESQTKYSQIISLSWFCLLYSNLCIFTSLSRFSIVTSSFYSEKWWTGMKVEKNENSAHLLLFLNLLLLLRDSLIIFPYSLCLPHILQESVHLLPKSSEWRNLSSDVKMMCLLFFLWLLYIFDVFFRLFDSFRQFIRRIDNSLLESVLFVSALLNCLWGFILINEREHDWDTNRFCWGKQILLWVCLNALWVPCGGPSPFHMWRIADSSLHRVDELLQLGVSLRVDLVR